MKFIVPVLILFVVAVSGELVLIGEADGFTFYAETDLDLTWTEARSYCRDNGMYFASIDTSAKDKLVSDWLAINLGRYGSLWTSGTDEDEELNFIWETSGQSFDYTNWHFGLGEDGPQADPTRNCVRVGGSNQGVFWAPVECSDSLNILCQG